MLLDEVLTEATSAEAATPVPGTPAVPFDAEEPLVVRIPWWAYVRAMANLYWSCVRHPLSDTTIDLSTGRVLYRD